MEGVDEVWMLILSSENILLVSACELNLQQRYSKISPKSSLVSPHYLIILVQEIDLVRVTGVWIREEEIVRRQTDRIQSELRPLFTDPLDQLSVSITRRKVGFLS